MLNRRQVIAAAVAAVTLPLLPGKSTASSSVIAATATPHPGLARFAYYWLYLLEKQRQYGFDCLAIYSERPSNNQFLGIIRLRGTADQLYGITYQGSAATSIEPVLSIWQRWVTSVYTLGNVESHLDKIRRPHSESQLAVPIGKAMSSWVHLSNPVVSYEEVYEYVHGKPAPAIQALQA